jgi:uncharacterized protein
MHLVMKLSKLCNLRCTYCYEYAELANKERMAIESIDYFFNSVAQNVLKRGNNVPVDLILHGGEPLLLPREYLRAVGALREKHFASNGITNTVAVQSNLFRSLRRRSIYWGNWTFSSECLWTYSAISASTSRDATPRTKS